MLAQAARVSPTAREGVPLPQADGRVLAEAIAADRDQPPFDRSTRDGYAVRAAELASGASLRVIGSLRAGERWSGPALGSGEALEIMTGAPVPAGADCVAMLEHVSRTADSLHAQDGRVWTAGDNIVPRGAEARRGDTVVPAGRLLGPAEIAAAASSGAAEVSVHARPRVALIATGDELVELADQPEAWQIRNSNSYALATLVKAAGGSPERLTIARDDLADLHERIAQGAMWDLLVLSGGVSMGKHDLVEQVLEGYGAEFFFTGAWIQPGKPVVFGRLPKSGEVLAPGASRNGAAWTGEWTGEWTYFFGLPGNPVSTEVCFHLFVAPMLRALAGRTDLAPAFVEARLTEAVKPAPRMRFLPARLASAWDKVTVSLVPWQGSGDVAANARAGCFCVLPPETALSPGDTVRVLLR